MRAAVALVVLLGVGCENAEQKKREAEARQKAFMEAETKARADQEAREAREAFEKASAGCDGGSAAACVELARIHFDGKGVERDIAKAVSTYARACALKSAEACRLAAQHETDAGKRLQHLVALCDLQDAGGCVQAAALADQLGQKPEPKKAQDKRAMQLLKKGCGLGSPIACTARGMGIAAEDPKAAVESFSRGCELGEPTSCMQLAAHFQSGKGVKKKDPAKALEFKKKACALGLQEAC
jgi:TPR repeat protein